MLAVPLVTSEGGWTVGGEDGDKVVDERLRMKRCQISSKASGNWKLNVSGWTGQQGPTNPSRSLVERCRHPAQAAVVSLVILPGLWAGVARSQICRLSTDLRAQRSSKRLEADGDRPGDEVPNGEAFPDSPTSHLVIS